jgi:hypothetical protein
MTGARTKAPASCEDLCPAKVVRALERSFGQIPAAARELGISMPDLRRLVSAQPALLEEALEELELAVIQAQSVVIQALDSPDWRRRAWASDKIMSSHLARGHPLSPAPRGAARASVSSPQQVTFRWATRDSAAATDALERDGQTLPVPRYGDDLVTPPEGPAPAGLVSPSREQQRPPKWPGPHAPPPLVANRYQPWAPSLRREAEREPEVRPELEPRRRMSRGGYR